MTIQEAGRIYGRVPLLFSSYYKYSFSFLGTSEDGAIIHASFGGCAEDIYQFSVERETPMFLGENPEEKWTYVRIERAGEELINYYYYM
jgi:hypothetical protein